MTTRRRPAGRGLRIGALAAVLGALLVFPGASEALAASRPTPAPVVAGPARDAFFRGDLARAATLAQQTGDRWIGGLAAYRLKDYASAFNSFAAVADDGAQADKVRSAAGFWAARAADRQALAAAGKVGSDQAVAYLKAAAAFPQTFYGVIAQRRLALLSGEHPTGPLADSLPLPVLAPTGGFTVAKALVYAIVLRESRFDATAKGGGAFGLMQITPATAARVMGDAHLARDPSALHDAAFNLRVGQDYITRLLGSVKGDLLRAVAAYNSGPGAILKTSAQLGDAADTLMVLESLPGAGVRDYVQKVMTNYWTYRGQFGKATSPTLDAAAGEGKLLLASLDD